MIDGDSHTRGLLTTVDDRLDSGRDVAPRDAVLLLREWGTDRYKLLPHAPDGDWLIGTSAECVFRLMDRRSAPKHAQVTCEGERWWIRDLGTPHGLRQDGVPRREFVLTPGVEIGIGATVLVAESVRCAELRGFVQRLLGWGRDRMCAVDHALRAMRSAIAHRSPLVLRGDGDLVPIAQALHRLAFGDDAPFVVCDPRRGARSASVRSPTSHVCGVDAFASALGGSICVRRWRPPADFDELMQRLFAPDSEVLLFACARDSQSETLVAPMAIHLPPLQVREIELPRIIEDYATDAIAALKAQPGSFTDDDQWWVRKHSARTLPEIEKGTRRVVALTMSSSISNAASRLGMERISLDRWLARRASIKSRTRRAWSARQARIAEGLAQASRAGER